MYRYQEHTLAATVTVIIVSSSCMYLCLNYIPIVHSLNIHYVAKLAIVYIIIILIPIVIIKTLVPSQTSRTLSLVVYVAPSYNNMVKGHYVCKCNA